MPLPPMLELEGARGGAMVASETGPWALGDDIARDSSLDTPKLTSNASGRRLGGILCVIHMVL